MKTVNKKLIVLTAVILVPLAGLITAVSLHSGSMMMSLKSEYASFIEKDGIVTEVRFHAPANFNTVHLDLQSKTSRDEHGSEYRTITYNGSVKKTFFASMPAVTINRPCTYVFVFSDKTVTITDGKITDSLQK